MQENEREDLIGEAVNWMQNFMEQSGFMETAQLLKQHILAQNKGGVSKNTKEIPDQAIRSRGKDHPSQLEQDDAISEVTIYRNAIKPARRSGNVNLPLNNRDSMSSEEEYVNTSGESKRNDGSGEIVSSQQIGNNNIQLLFAGSGEINQPRMDQQKPDQDHNRGRSRYVEDGQIAGTSRDFAERRQYEDRGAQVILEAEAGRARIHETPGEFNNRMKLAGPESPVEKFMIDLSKQFVHSAMVDESYQIVALHLDEAIQDKIMRGDYVDFGRLIPKDRIQIQEEYKVEMKVKDGKTYWSTSAGEDTTQIASYVKWEQAFRIYSDVYLRAHPDRAVELIQYNHMIHMASQTYLWENVYLYDRDFRLHLARNPTRSWAIILQQAWSFRLKDRLRTGNNNMGSSGNNSNNSHKNDRREICRKFNRGRCTYGFSCKFDHRCSYCFKFGHGAQNCHCFGLDKTDKNDYFCRRSRSPPDRRGFRTDKRERDLKEKGRN